jgi:hypothetical protein
VTYNIDPGWWPYIATPGFPSYTSGHSTQSGAAARALTDMFGLKSFTDTTHTDHGLPPPQQPRTFNSFDEAALEAAVSRLYRVLELASRRYTPKALLQGNNDFQLTRGLLSVSL